MVLFAYVDLFICAQGISFHFSLMFPQNITLESKDNVLQVKKLRQKGSNSTLQIQVDELSLELWSNSELFID